MFATIKEILLYIILFIGLYFQVFLILSYFFWGKKEESQGLKLEAEAVFPIYEPHVGIIVPCYNEALTVEKTMASLLALDYPREKLHIAIVDDGSKDATWDVVQQYKNNVSVELLQKVNEGSKFAALNYGLAHLRTNTQAEVIGCLDADSSVDPDALRASMRAFVKSSDIMAVMPAMTIENPKSVWQYMQKVEYEMMTFGKQVFHNLESIFVAPGPFALFKRKVFDELGPYTEAYHTEDLEICLRMIMRGMKIVFANDAYVYTRGPRTLNALIKQRVRWIYGFVKNMQDYKSMMFTPKYGHISIFILPVSVVGIWSFLILVPILLAQIGILAYNLYEKYSIVSIKGSELSLFYVNTKPYVMITILSLIVLVTTVMLGRSILKHKRYITVDLLTFILYSYVVMVWTIKALVNALRSKKSAWR
jgi:cellulose synthase/poly-beta-1,6-N-acetylglucosamine synthase-like glycosyltransferase